MPKQKDHDFYTTWMKSEGYDGEGFNRSGRGILGYGTIDKGATWHKHWGSCLRQEIHCLFQAILYHGR